MEVQTTSPNTHSESLSSRTLNSTETIEIVLPLKTVIVLFVYALSRS